jgi:salicylate hydroxylase
MKADPITAPLMETGNLKAWWGPGRHIITLPLRQANMYDMIAVFDETYEGKPETPLHTNWNSKGDVKHLRAAFADHETSLRKVLEYVPAEECRLWNILSLPDLRTWVSSSGKVALLGDAAHAMRPYLAQVSCISVSLHKKFPDFETREQLWPSRMAQRWQNAYRVQRPSTKSQKQ